MDKLEIQGAGPLDGRVLISGAKNAALPILAGSLLSDEPVLLANVPHLNDVTTTVKLLRRLGVDVTIHDGMTLEVNPASINQFSAPYELVKTMRASVLVLGPLLARARQGGCVAAGGLCHWRATGGSARCWIQSAGSRCAYRGWLYPCPR